MMENHSQDIFKEVNKTISDIGGYLDEYKKNIYKTCVTETNNSLLYSLKAYNKAKKKLDKKYYRKCPCFFIFCNEKPHCYYCYCCCLKKKYKNQERIKEEIKNIEKNEELIDIKLDEIMKINENKEINEDKTESCLKEISFLFGILIFSFFIFLE